MESVKNCVNGNGKVVKDWIIGVCGIEVMRENSYL